MSVTVVDPARIDAFTLELRELLPDAVSTDDGDLERASTDGSHLSPVIAAQLPLGRAQVVVTPASVDDIPAIVRAAVRHGVPITPRGKGTANYGQTLPMAGGAVLDLSRLRRVVEVGDGWLTAEAGAPMIAVEQAANRAGQQVLMYPSTAQSSIGGFVSGGSGGTGSIKHGMLHTGFVTALDVVHATEDAELVRVEGADTEKYLHKYGTVAIIARVTVRLEPLQDWRAFFASFDDYHDLLGVIRQIGRLEPTPRLVSGDGPVLAGALPADPAILPGKASLRAILDEASVAEATALVEAAGGTVVDVRTGAPACIKLSMTSYNHPIEWLQKAYPNTYFHVEVIGDGLVERIDELEAVYPGGMLHVEAQQGRPIGMLAGRYSSPEEVYAGFPRIEALGVGYHNPHQWFVDYEPEATRELAAQTDPTGILNPGKLDVAATVDTGSQL
ncbi:FAD-binding oxidoreductase [Microbacterium sp. No. 7]|uniref:FAD-binding oxidoreductase n=1 Tax=Microbacterium sp. No. 7 TaxID=1714373 RepID=UPI0006D00695|nr:FAD-binding oxidoreductase [Microbacterium sp. No. 7]ALJ22184.1 dehydrogenase [Microbacterium sp. No. 7]